LAGTSLFTGGDTIIYVYPFFVIVGVFGF